MIFSNKVFDRTIFDRGAAKVQYSFTVLWTYFSFFRILHFVSMHRVGTQAVNEERL